MVSWQAVSPCCRAASVLPPWNSRSKIELIFGVMLQFNVVWCIRSRREIVLTIQSDNGKQGYKVGGKKYRRPKVVLSQRLLRTVLQRLDSETRGILSSQRGSFSCWLQVCFSSMSCRPSAWSALQVLAALDLHLPLMSFMLSLRMKQLGWLDLPFPISFHNLWGPGCFPSWMECKWHLICR